MLNVDMLILCVCSSWGASMNCVVTSTALRNVENFFDLNYRRFRISRRTTFVSQRELKLCSFWGAPVMYARDL